MRGFRNVRNCHENKVKLRNLLMDLKIGFVFFERNVNVSGISRHTIMFFWHSCGNRGTLTSGWRQETMSYGESANSPELSYRDEWRFQDRS